MTSQDTPTYSEGNMITGMCLWETFLTLAAPRAGDDDAEDAEAPEDSDLSDAYDTARAGELLDDHGSFTIRAALISLVKPCEDAWAAHSAGKDDGEQFDWDWCPRFLRGAMADGTLADAIEGQYRP